MNKILVKEVCPVCEKEELVEYITTQGKYYCCENCNFEYKENTKYE